MSTRTAQGNRTAKGKADGLLHIFLLAVLFAAVGANPAVAQVQLPTVNLGDTNFQDGFGAPGWFLEGGRVCLSLAYKQKNYIEELHKSHTQDYIHRKFQPTS